MLSSNYQNAIKKLMDDSAYRKAVVSSDDGNKIIQDFNLDENQLSGFFTFSPKLAGGKGGNGTICCCSCCG